jgi:KDO2-lipid IV(A) lauroyltransferase
MLLTALLSLPYRWRVPVMGGIVAHLVAPLAGWRQRIRENLSYACPELDPAEVRRLTRAVPANVGRTLIEIYSGDEFVRRVRDTSLSGPGVDAFLEARAADRPVILVTAHFGNYDAPRAALFAQGHPLAALYRPMENESFNDHYVKAISRIGEPLFPVDRKGVLGFVNYLRAGNVVGILTDVHAGRGALLTYFGQVAPTATSAAEWALRYDALLLPIYGRRLESGLDFEIFLDTPVPHTDPETMTQALNDSLERIVRDNMDQWFWIHRRWKPERRAAA